jgi:tRNA(adenine34) deaminase
MTDETCMDRALALAQEAFARGDWPVASVIVRDGRILGAGQNRQNSGRDVTLHAEMEALRSAFTAGAGVAGATLYSTMEPCPMCAAAMRMAGIRRLVLGLRHADLRRTDLGSYSIEAFCAMMDWPLEIVTGVRHAECLEIRVRWGRDEVR